MSCIRMLMELPSFLRLFLHKLCATPLWAHNSIPQLLCVRSHMTIIQWSDAGYTNSSIQNSHTYVQCMTHPLTMELVFVPGNMWCSITATCLMYAQHSSIIVATQSSIPQKYKSSFLCTHPTIVALFYHHNKPIVCIVRFTLQIQLLSDWWCPYCPTNVVTQNYAI